MMRWNCRNSFDPIDQNPGDRPVISLYLRDIRRRVTSMSQTSLALAVALSVCLPTAALPDDLTTTNPESLGFSTTRLARIGAWYQARVETGDVSGAVVAIARGDHLAYFQAVGFQDRAKTIPIEQDSIFW